MPDIPDSPEGVAYALMMLILAGKFPEGMGVTGLVDNEIFELYRRCLETVRGEPPYISREKRANATH